MLSSLSKKKPQIKSFDSNANANADSITGEIFEIISRKEIAVLDKQKIMRQLVDLINESFVIPHYFLQLKFALRRAWW